jgi:integrase/recombinase XerD
MGWDQILTSYEAHQRAENRAPRTIEGRRLLLKSLARTTGKRPEKITLDDLLTRMGRGIAPSSMQRERSDLQSFFSWAKKHHYVPKNPAKNLPKVTVPRGRPRPLTVAQVQLMLEGGAYRRTRIMILLGLYQGLRAHEIAKFRGDDIDLTSMTLNVIGKGAKEATLPLHPIIAAIAATMPAEFWFPARKGNTLGHIHYRSVSDLMSRAIRRAGITDPNLTGHSLRHSYGTELVGGGVDIRIVQELLRHASLNSTQIYTGVTMKQTRDGQATIPLVTLTGISGRLAA